MIIKAAVLQSIDNPITRTKVALALGQGEQSVAIACRKNSNNGPLTKLAAIMVIRQETGLDIDEIVQSETEQREVA